ncbi:hypothetical protein EVB71_008 [Rhizobium phage RHph_Y55]|nr:hypothetical protein EVB71_008 [Rhizobium phage RHph_Y55]
MSDGVNCNITMTEGAFLVISHVLDEAARVAVTKDYKTMLEGYANDLRKAIVLTEGNIFKDTPNGRKTLDKIR